ncbi:Abhydrolase-2 domain-containing protein [Aphelenchoides fujianensis]|nr:Abhydrolase-2 domain-containing protein [Aphelenchoides fujianensis]
MSAPPVCGRSPFETSSHGQQKGTIIFLHGLGDQGDGWSQILSRVLNKNQLKVICPNAGVRPVTLNFGMQMPAWYDLKGLSPDSPEDVDGITAATKYVHSLIQKEIDAGINPKQIAVGGFSMGGALAIHAALTFPSRLGAVVGLSSFLLQRDAIEGACKANRDVPIFLGHGTEDVLVPLTFGQMTEQKIRTFNPNVLLNTYEVDHSTNEKLAHGRRSPVLIPKGGGVIVAGGCEEGRHLDTSEQLDVKLEIRPHSLRLPHGLSCAASAQLEDGSTLIFGGFNATGCLKENAAAVRVDDGRVLLFGGWDESRTLQTVFSYDSKGGQEFYSLLSSPVEGHTANRHGDHVLLVGGFDGLTVVDSVLRFDLKTSRSEVVGRLRIARENHAAVTFEHEGEWWLLVIGGWDGRTALDDCELFRLLPHAPWIERAESSFRLNTPRNRPAAIVLDS